MKTYQKENLRLLLKKLDEIICAQTDLPTQNQLNWIRHALLKQIEDISLEFVRDALDFYLQHHEAEPFYSSLRELDKVKIAKLLNRSRSYVYQAIRKRSLSSQEIAQIQAAYSQLL